jgi:hypothetical protein
MWAIWVSIGSGVGAAGGRQALVNQGHQLIANQGLQ